MENNNAFIPLTNQQASEILKDFHKRMGKTYMRPCLDEAFIKAIDLLMKIPDNSTKERDTIE